MHLVGLCRYTERTRGTGLAVDAPKNTTGIEATAGVAAPVPVLCAGHAVAGGASKRESAG